MTVRGEGHRCRTRRILSLSFIGLDPYLLGIVLLSGSKLSGGPPRSVPAEDLPSVLSARGCKRRDDSLEWGEWGGKTPCDWQSA